MQQYIVPVILGVLFGFLGRVILLKTDYRQYPTHPHGNIIHLAMGLIAAGLGSIAIPALLEREFTAITFLTVAAQQFREVRNMERETLSKLDEVELISRGRVYIEGIAMVFEGRNYLVIMIAFFTTLSTQLLTWWVGIIVGIACSLFAFIFKSGKTLDKIADIEPADVIVERENVTVNDIYIMNVGLKESLEIISKRAIGIILKPKSIDSVVTLANPGQQQAILHDLSVGLGIFRDSDKPSLTPLSRRDLEDGRVAIFFLPQIKNMDRAIEVVKEVPVLENAVRIPSESEAKQAHERGRV